MDFAAEEHAAEVLLAALEADHQAMVAASDGSNADDEHDPEGATIAFEREQLTAAIERTRRRLADISESRARQAAGTYGICEVCAEPIPAARLDARPHARTCVDHA